MENEQKKPTKKSESFWKNGLSIDETRVSVIVILTVIGLIYSLYSHYDTGDITTNLLELVKMLIIGIIGVNGTKFLSDAVQGRNKDSNKSTYNDYDNN